MGSARVPRAPVGVSPTASNARADSELKKDPLARMTPLFFAGRMLAVIVNALCFLSATVFAVLTLRTLFFIGWCQRLPKIELGAERERPHPRCSVIFAARDEEDRVEETIRHILSQQGVELELIAVDDRSRDGTSAVLKRLAAEDARVKPKRVDRLPENWLGKCHACDLGARSATGDWLLFTDADCWLKPDVLSRALTVAEREAVDHVTLTPGVAPQTIAAEGWHLAFLITVVDWIAKVNLDKPGAHLGIGAFNLVRAETYRAFGGHETLRLTVVDDVKLGRLVRRVGGRTRAFLGGDDVECHWGVTIGHIVKIMEKNYFAAVDYRIAVALLVGTVLPVFWAVALMGPFTGTLLGWAAGLALVSSAIPAGILAGRLRWPMRGAVATPFVFVCLFYALLRSTLVTLRRGGIRWRDTFYPLELLRANNVA